MSSRSFPSMRFDDSCLQWDAVDTQACFWCLDRFNPLCGEFGVLRWFFKLVYGVGQSEGVSSMGDCVSVSRTGRIAKPAEIFIKSSEKIVPVFSAVVIRVSKFSKMSLKDRRQASFNRSSMLECGARSACVLR